MKFKIDKAVLSNVLKMVGGSIEKRDRVPILSHVYLSLENGDLIFKTTDSEIETRAKCTVSESIENGVTTIPARKMQQIVNVLPDGKDVNVGLKDGKVSINSGRSRFSLNTLDADDFPGMEFKDHNAFFTVNREKLREILDAVKCAMASNDVRYYLNGIELKVEKERIRLAATDGHRLAFYNDHSISVKDLGEGEHSYILPRRAINEMILLLRMANCNDVQFYVNQFYARLVLGEYEFVTRLIDGKYPDISRVIPQEADSVCHTKVDREALKSALQRTAILANEKLRSVELDVSDSEILLKSENNDKEDSLDYVGCGFSGTPVKTGFNSDYLIDALSTFTCNEVSLFFGGTDKPLKIKDVQSEGDVGVLHIVMPMKV